MKIIIVGAGEIGTHLALKLAETNHSVVVIEADKTIAAELETQLDGRIIVGDGASPEVQLDADVPGCDVLFALTSDNNVNLVASTVAKNFEAKRTVCRLHQALESQNFLFDFKAHFGIDDVFSSERLAAVQLSKYIRNPDSDKERVVEEIAGGFIELIELPVSRKSDVVGVEIRNLKFPKRVLICVIKRGDEIIIPTAERVIEAGDVLTLAGPHKPIGDVIKRVEPEKKRKTTNVVIFGGGEYGFALAQTLAASGGDFKIRIFESDEERARILAEQLSNVTVLNTDATSLAELKEENVGEADFFVATTTRDEDNVMTCLQANSLGAKYCLTLFHRADYADAITKFKGKMGILAAVSPREATRTMLMRFVADSFHLLRRLHGTELIEVSVQEDSVIKGKLVREVDWPEECILVGLWHGSDVLVPSAEDKIEVGDNIYAMVSKKSKRAFLNLLS